MRWFTSDLHFGHAKVIGYCARPWATLEEMHAGLIHGWNSRVRSDDQVFVLGDFALYLRKRDVVEILKQLNGRKILVKGNHDHRDNYKAEGWVKVVGSVHTGLTDGTEAYLIHDPADLDKYHEKPVGLVLHGHHHGNKGMRGDVPNHPDRIHLDVSVDVDGANYAPFSEDEIIRRIKERP